MYMHINANALVSAPGCAHAEVCHLRSHARKRGQAFDGIGYVRVEFITQNLGSLLDVFRLPVVESDLVDEGVQCGRLECQDGFKIEAL